MKKTDSVMMGINSDDDANYMYNGAIGNDDYDDDEDEYGEDNGEEYDHKKSATDDTTIARLVEASMDAAQPLPPVPTILPPAGAVAAIGAATPTVVGATDGNIIHHNHYHKHCWICHHSHRRC